MARETFAGHEWELDYVCRDEDGQPDADWRLRSEYSRPWLYEIDDDSVCVAWVFGPQGHPASLAVHLNLFHEEGFAPHLHVLGPNPKSGDRCHWQGSLPSTRYLKALLIYGHRIEQHFGHDPFWHRCRQGCYGTIPAETPPYQRCPDCAAVSQRAEAATRDWLFAHPFPQPEGVLIAATDLPGVEG